MSESYSKSLVKETYNRTIRHHLPRKWIVCAGVPTRDARLFDVSDHRPSYKQGLIEAIHAHVDDGDTVVLVGGGRGVTTVHSTRAGAQRVVAIEAASQMVDIAREAVEIEDPPATVEFRHALVGEAVDVFGELDGAAKLLPSELPAGDVLLMDCEGAEVSILESMEGQYGKVIVETHPEKGAPTEEAVSDLQNLGYAVSTREYEPGNAEKRVLVGTREDSA